MPTPKLHLPGFLSVAAVWFVTHAGGGFCTGRQEVEFFVQYGRSALFMPFVSMAVLAMLLFISWELARICTCYHYKAFTNHVYQPYQKILGPLFEAGFLLTVFLASSAGIAAGGHLIAELFPVPYLVSITITSTLVLALVIWGAALVRNASALLSFVIIVTIMVIIVVCLSPEVQHSLPTADFSARDGWLTKGMLYAMFQVWGLGSYIAVSQVLTTRKQVAATALTGFVLNGTVLFLICLVLHNHLPAVEKEPLPLLFVVESQGSPLLKGLYCAVLFLGNLSTAVVFMFGAVSRFEKTWSSAFSRLQSVHFRRIVLGVAMLAIAWCISRFGLLAIVAKGYSFLGYIAVPLIVVPLVVALRETG